MAKHNENDREAHDAVDRLRHLSAESAGEAGSDDSPRGTSADTAMGGNLNTGPNHPDFVATDESPTRSEATRQPDQADAPEEQHK